MSSREILSLRVPNQSPRPMPGISLVGSCRSLATGVRCCSARSSTNQACAGTSSSKARDARRFHAAAMDRAALGPVLREYIVSEAMATLGIPTTRALAAVATGESIQRETLLPGAVLTRVASSHIRIGTFQFFAARDDRASLTRLTDYVIARHYPRCGQSHKRAAGVAGRRDRPAGGPHRALDAGRVCPWRHEYGQCLHCRRNDRLRSVRLFGCLQSRNGVQFDRSSGGGMPMRTSLASRIGIWCAWPSAYYRYWPKMKPKRSRWRNALCRPSDHPYESALLTGARAKLGLLSSQPDDLTLWRDLLTCMAAAQADFTSTFRTLCDAVDGGDAGLPSSFADWLGRWRSRAWQ